MANKPESEWSAENDHEQAESEDFGFETMSAEDFSVESRAADIEVGSPPSTKWVRAAEEILKVTLLGIEIRGKYRRYMLNTEISEMLDGSPHVSRYVLLQMCTESGEEYLRPFKVHTPGVVSVIKAARRHWISVYWDREAGEYCYRKAVSQNLEPKFTDLPIEKIAEIAFKDRLISDPNHLLVRRELGIFN